MAKVKDKEMLIAQIMKEAAADGEPVTREEAEEMAEMEIKAQGVKIYAKSEESSSKPRKKREVKTDPDKLELMGVLSDAIMGFGLDAITVNPQREISFDWHGMNYSVVLTQHRKKKAGD